MAAWSPRGQRQSYPFSPQPTASTSMDAYAVSLGHRCLQPHLCHMLHLQRAHSLHAHRGAVRSVQLPSVTRPLLSVQQRAIAAHGARSPSSSPPVDPPTPGVCQRPPANSPTTVDGSLPACPHPLPRSVTREHIRAYLQRKVQRSSSSSGSGSDTGCDTAKDGRASDASQALCDRLQQIGATLPPTALTTQPSPQQQRPSQVGSLSVPPTQSSNATQSSPSDTTASASISPAMATQARPAARGRPKKLRGLDPTAPPATASTSHPHCPATGTPLPHDISRTGGLDGPANESITLHVPTPAQAVRPLLHGSSVRHALVSDDEMASERAWTNPVYRMIRKTELQIAYRGLRPGAAHGRHDTAGTVQQQAQSELQHGLSQSASQPQGRCVAGKGRATSDVSDPAHPLPPSQPAVQQSEMVSEGAWRNPVYRLIRKTELRMRQRAAAAAAQGSLTAPSSQRLVQAPAAPASHQPPSHPSGLASLFSLSDSLLSLAALEHAAEDLDPGAALATGLAASLDPDTMTTLGGATGPHRSHGSPVASRLRPAADSLQARHVQAASSTVASSQPAVQAAEQLADSNTDLGPLPSLPRTGHVGVDRAIRIRQLSLSQRRKQQAAAQAAGQPSSHQAAVTTSLSATSWPPTVTQRAADYQPWYPQHVSAQLQDPTPPWPNPHDMLPVAPASPPISPPVPHRAPPCDTPAVKPDATAAARPKLRSRTAAPRIPQSNIVRFKRGRPRTRSWSDTPLEPPRPRGRPRRCPAPLTDATEVQATAGPGMSLHPDLVSSAVDVLVRVLDLDSAAEGGGVRSVVAQESAASKARALLHRQPNLAYRTEASVTENLRVLATTLQLPQPRVVEAALRYPSLLDMKHTTVCQRYEHLVQLTVQHCPEIRALDVAGAVCECPALLGLTTPTLQHWLTALAHSLTPLCTPTSEPNTPDSDHHPTQDKEHTLCDADTDAELPAVPLTPAPTPAAMALVLRVVLACPGLTRTSIAKVVSKAEVLVAACRKVSRWWQGLTAMKPGYLGRCLSASSRVLSRLEYLNHLLDLRHEEVVRDSAAVPGNPEQQTNTSHTSLDSDMLSLGFVLMMREQEFVERFPGFEAWLQA